MDQLLALRLANLRARSALALRNLEDQRRLDAWMQDFERRMRPPITADDIRSNIGHLRYLLAVIRFEQLQHKARHPSGYDPDQPRVPKNNPDGGQWTRVANIGRYLQGLARSAVGRSLSRLDRAVGRAEQLIRRVGEVDPTWRPKGTGQGIGLESDIASAEDIAQQAHKRLEEIAQLPPDQQIAIYRSENRAPDLFGRDRWPPEKGTVGVTNLDGLPIFGANSNAPTYTAADRAAANVARNTLIEKYPELRQTENIGRRPNDAFYHAETTVLLRAARENGGMLTGRSLDVYVDRWMCGSCDKVLPLLGRELGNPTITYIDLAAGTRRVLQDGIWKQR